jgi:hypothetical protein
MWRPGTRGSGTPLRTRGLAFQHPSSPRPFTPRASAPFTSMPTCFASETLPLLVRLLHPRLCQHASSSRPFTPRASTPYTSMPTSFVLAPLRFVRLLHPRQCQHASSQPHCASCVCFATSLPTSFVRPTGGDALRVCGYSPFLLSCCLALLPTCVDSPRTVHPQPSTSD